MTGIILLSFLFIAFVVYCLLIYLPIRWAKRHGITGRKRFYIGIVSFFVVSVVFFGRNLISYTAFKYYCKNEAGMTVYKTLDEWKKENPGVWETLKKVNDFRDYKDKDKYPDVQYNRIINGEGYTPSSSGNQRIILYNRTDYIFWGALEVYSFKLIDKKTQEILADYQWYKWKNTWDTTRTKSGRRTISYLGNKSCNLKGTGFFKYARSFSNFSLIQEEK